MGGRMIPDSRYPQRGPRPMGRISDARPLGPGRKALAGPGAGGRVLTMADVLVWVGVVLLALCLASWAKYVVNRYSVEEREAHLMAPLVLTGLLVVVVAAVSIIDT